MAKIRCRSVMNGQENPLEFLYCEKSTSVSLTDGNLGCSQWWKTLTEACLIGKCTLWCEHMSLGLAALKITNTMIFQNVFNFPPIGYTLRLTQAPKCNFYSNFYSKNCGMHGMWYWHMLQHHMRPESLRAMSSMIYVNILKYQVLKFRKRSIHTFCSNHQILETNDTIWYVMWHADILQDWL